jgi:hypothetical protein
MDDRYRPMQYNDLNQIVSLSLLAWEPVLVSFESILGSTIFTRIYPDWRADQAKAVEEPGSLAPGVADAASIFPEATPLSIQTGNATANPTPPRSTAPSPHHPIPTQDPPAAA